MTFGGFVDHLRALVSHALPKIDVATVVYPKFDTRGDLKECVGRFREWFVSLVHIGWFGVVVDCQRRKQIPFLQDP